MANPEAPESTAQAPSLDVENGIQQKLVSKFASLSDQVTVQRARRMWAKVPMAELHPVMVYAKDELGFDQLCTITGTDEGADLGLLYHMANDDGVVLTLVTSAPKDGPGPDTVTPYFPLAELYEREVIDLLGARIQGLPDGNRYPLPDAWPEGQYPLRKDWKPEGAQAAAKIEAKPEKEK